MILIISQDQEITTTEVIRWLTYMNKKFIRVNDDENFSIRIINKRFYLEMYVFKLNWTFPKRVF